PGAERVVEEVAPVEAVAGGEDREEFGRIVVVTPVQQLAIACGPAVEPAGQHLEGADQRQTEGVLKRGQWFEGAQPVGELPEGDEVVGEVEGVTLAQQLAAPAQRRSHRRSGLRRGARGGLRPAQAARLLCPGRAPCNPWTNSPRRLRPSRSRP